MDPKISLQKDIDKIIAGFQDKPDIAALYLFGSAAKEKSHAKSDLDVAVMFSGYRAEDQGLDFLGYIADMEGLTSRKVDLVCFNTADPLLRHQILKFGKLIMDRAPETRVKLMVQTMIEYEEYKRHLDLSFAMMKRGLGNHE